MPGDELNHPHLDAWASRCAAAIAQRLPSWPGAGIWLLLIATLVLWNVLPRSESQMWGTMSHPGFGLWGWPAMLSFRSRAIEAMFAEHCSARGFAINLLLGCALSGLVYGMDRMLAQRAFSLRTMLGVMVAAALVMGCWVAAMRHNVEFVEECGEVTKAARERYLQLELALQ